MIKVETKLYVGDKELLSFMEEISEEIFKKKIYKDVEVHAMAMRNSYNLRINYDKIVKELNKKLDKTIESNKKRSNHENVEH